MDYLVTGAAGFIGGNIVQKLIDGGHKCTTIDNLSTGSKEQIPKECVFYEGDLGSSETIRKIQDKRFDAIIHMAGQSSGEISFEDPVYDLQTNTQSTLRLLKYAVETGCKKFIYASSMSTYGDADPPLCSETTSTVPKSLYAVGKLASENYLRIFSSMGLSCTALRFFNVYGKGQNMDNLKQGMVSIYLAMAIRNRHIHVKGAKERFRDFVYIDDVVDAVIKSLDISEGYNMFNVCTGIATTVETVIDTIKHYLPYDVSVEYSGTTPGDQFGIYGDNTKIKDFLHWEPRYSFEEGMKEFIDWAQEKLK